MQLYRLRVSLSEFPSRYRTNRASVEHALLNDGVEGGGRTRTSFRQGISSRSRGYSRQLTAGYQVVFTGVSVGKERFVSLGINTYPPIFPSSSRHLDNQNAQTQRAEFPILVGCRRV